MAQPNPRPPALSEFLDGLSRKLWGRERVASITAGICVKCGGTATHFTDEIAAQEYPISGLCQQCQATVF